VTEVTTETTQLPTSATSPEAPATSSPAPPVSTPTETSAVPIEAPATPVEGSAAPPPPASRVAHHRGGATSPTSGGVEAPLEVDSRAKRMLIRAARKGVTTAG
jgi:hypothetical protein